MVLSGRYPTYTGYTGVGNKLDCTSPDSSTWTDYDISLDVDTCMCGKVDGGGQPIYFMEGLQAAATGLANGYIVSDALSGTTRVAPDSALSTITDKNGNTIGDIAFVLVSFGRNRQADHTSYVGIEQAEYLARPPARTPNFDPNAAGLVAGIEYVDDVVVYALGSELIANVAR